MSRITGALAALFLGVALAGCQTASIDTLETASYRPAVPGAGDLASGKSHFRAANYGLAEQHFRKAAELDGSNAEAWMGLAASYDQLGRFDFADRAYEQLVKLAGRQPRIVNNMGYSQFLRGDHARARQLYAEARKGLADPSLVDANIALLN